MYSVSPILTHFILKGGYGDWSSDGCNTSSDSDPQVTCHCNHLTNFAILLVRSTYTLLKFNTKMCRMCLLVQIPLRGQD